MNKLKGCELCGELAAYTMQPDGGRVSYWCAKHYKETVNELMGSDGVDDRRDESGKNE